MKKFKTFLYGTIFGMFLVTLCYMLVNSAERYETDCEEDDDFDDFDCSDDETLFKD